MQSLHSGRQYERARLRQFDVAGGAIEQDDMELCLQLPYESTSSRLVDPQLGGGTAEVLLLCDGDEGSQGTG